MNADGKNLNRSDFLEQKKPKGRKAGTTAWLLIESDDVTQRREERRDSITDSKASEV
jgi:hypothetical protein